MQNQHEWHRGKTRDSHWEGSGFESRSVFFINFAKLWNEALVQNQENSFPSYPINQ